MVESEELIIKTALSVKKSGAHFLKEVWTRDPYK